MTGTGPGPRVPGISGDRDLAASAVDVDYVYRVGGDDDEVDLEAAPVGSGELDIVHDRPGVRGLVAQVSNDGSLRVVGGFADTDDPCHLPGRPFHCRVERDERLVLLAVGQVPVPVCRADGLGDAGSIGRGTQGDR